MDEVRRSAADPSDCHPSGSGPRSRRWAPVVGLVVAIALTAVGAAALRGGDDATSPGGANVPVGIDDDGPSAAAAATDPANPPDGTYRGSFPAEYFDALGDAVIADNELVVEIVDGVVTEITGGWMATDVPAQTDGATVLCRATYLGIHDLVEAEPLDAGRGTAAVGLTVIRDGLVSQPAMPEGEDCDPGLSLPTESILAADFAFTGGNGRVQFHDDTGQPRGLVALGM